MSTILHMHASVMDLLIYVACDVKSGWFISRLDIKSFSCWITTSPLMLIFQIQFCYICCIDEHDDDVNEMIVKQPLGHFLLLHWIIEAFRRCEWTSTSRVQPVKAETTCRTCQHLLVCCSVLREVYCCCWKTGLPKPSFRSFICWEGLVVSAFYP